MHLETISGKVTIRQAETKDSAAFRALRLEALRSHPEAFSADCAFNEAQPMAYWEGRLSALEGEHNKGMIYFAEHEDRLVGMCGVQRGDSPKTRHTAWIWGVYVADKWRGLRVAEHLIERSSNWAGEHGVTSLKLGVATNNSSAIRCYLRCGFTVYGVEPQAINIDGKLIDELLMVRYMP